MHAGGRRFDSGQLHQSFPGGSKIEHFPQVLGEGINGLSFFDNRLAAFFVLTKLYGQVIKSIRGMPWCRKATKDVASCEKLR